MGKGITDAVKDAIGQAGADPRKNLEAEVARLTKLVHILWREVEKLEGMIQVTREGLKIKAGRSEIFVYKNGAIILSGASVMLEVPGKNKLLAPGVDAF